MANWQMEVGKMVLYILFPVGVFYYTNTMENMDEWLIVKKERCLPGDDKKHKEFVKFIDEFNSKKRLQQLEEMEQQYNKIKTTHFAEG